MTTGGCAGSAARGEAGIGARPQILPHIALGLGQVRARNRRGGDPRSEQDSRQQGERWKAHVEPPRRVFDIVANLARISHTIQSNRAVWGIRCVTCDCDGVPVGSLELETSGLASRSGDGVGGMGTGFLVRQATACTSKAWASRNSCWEGQPEAMASLTRRTLTVTTAPILRSARRVALLRSLGSPAELVRTFP